MQASQSPLQATMAQPSYQTPQPSLAGAQVPQAAPAPAVNPWQEAYQRLSESLSGQQPSRPQEQPWPQTQPAGAPSGYYHSQPSNLPSAFNTAIPTSPYQVTPAYSAPSPTAWTPLQNPSVPQVAPQNAAAAAAAAGDGYLSGLSNESLEVLGHFGAEAPALLNAYACTVEDALLNQAQQSTQALKELQQLHKGFNEMDLVLKAVMEDNKAYNHLVTNPRLLADYTSEFFGPNGPVPVEIPEDRLRADVNAAMAARAGVPASRPQGQAPAQAPGYQRPQLEMPAPGGYQPGGDDFWGQFREVSARRPDQLWRVLSQATPEMLRAKMLISDTPVE